MKKEIVLLKSDMGKLVATPSGIWLCKGEDALSVSWEEVIAAQQAGAVDGAWLCANGHPNYNEEARYCLWCDAPRK